VEKWVAQRFRKLRKGAPPDVERLVDAMEWAFSGGGKRLRPLMAFAACEASCGDPRPALPGAVAVELIHTYSLVHDDLPDLDDDGLRRGRATVHVRYGPALAILAGDALQSLAFVVLADASARPGGDRRTSVAVRILARAAGPLGMCGGQAEDLAFEGKDPDVSERAAMSRRKTGEMIAASLQVGAALGGMDGQGLARLRRVGLAAGEAFQIRDDLLNMTGDPAVTGKAKGSDAARGKASLGAALGPKAATARAEELARYALAQAKSFMSPRLDSLLALLVSRDS
jgi:geranylgeranyl diphosphate synthase type II